MMLQPARDIEESVQFDQLEIIAFIDHRARNPKPFTYREQRLVVTRRLRLLPGDDNRVAGKTRDPGTGACLVKEAAQ